MIRWLLSLFRKPPVPPTQTEPPAQPEPPKRPALPETAAAYREVLTAVLDTQTTHAVAQLHGLVDAMPEKATDLTIMIHPDQDGEGSFSVMCHVGGPDLYVLNKAVKPWRQWFAITQSEAGTNHPVPLYDPFDQPFGVNDTACDVAGDWIETVWQTADVTLNMPVIVFADEDWGTTFPRKLTTPS